MIGALFKESNENGDEFTGFLLERVDKRRLKVFFGFKELHPELRFIGFAETITELGAIFRTRAASLGFAVVCTDRTAGAEQLFAPDLSNTITRRQGAISTGDTKREFARSMS